MQYDLNTKQARKLVNALIKQKNTSVWNSWTNAVQKDLDNVPNKRNLCFGILGDKFTEGECKWIKLLVGCDKVHFTDNGRYLRLVGVRFEG